jgi:hypothetical protein
LLRPAACDRDGDKEGAMRLSRRAWGALAVLSGVAGAAIFVQPSCTESPPAPTEVISRAAVARTDWMQFGGGPSHAGSNTSEQTIGRSNVAGLAQLFKVTLPETAEGQPMILTSVSTTQGTRDLAFLTTRNGYLVALDARTGVAIWQRQFAGTNITMSSPAIDPARTFVYGAGTDGKIHKVKVGDGSEVTTDGWPQVASLKNTVEKDGTALTIATIGGVNFLYMGTGGYLGDGGDYQGHLTTINLATGAQKVFNAMCSDQTIHFGGSTDCAAQKSGIWAKAGVTFDALTARVYVVTGNGLFSPATFMWGDSILALNPDGTGVGNGDPVDSYTPVNYQTLQTADLDLGSTNLLVLPNNGSIYPHLGAQGGKDQVVRLIDLDDMSGEGGPGHVGGELSAVALTTGGEVQDPSSTWVNPVDGSTWVYVVSPKNGVNAYQLTISNGSPALAPRWSARGANNGGASVANGVLYYAQSSNFHAVDPTTGAALWSSTAIGAIHWQAPTVANGVVYIADNSKALTAFALRAAGGAGGGGGASGAGGSTGAAGTTGAGGSTGTAGTTGAGGSTGAAGTTGAGGSGGVAASRINCGGLASPPFVADVDFNGGTTVRHTDPVDRTQVTDPAPEAVYQSARIGGSKYTIPGFAAGSSHVVRLHMCENFYRRAGFRLFNVTINGTQVLTSFDIFATTGGMHRAIVEQFTARADSNGKYVIQTKTLKGSSLLSGIEIR